MAANSFKEIYPRRGILHHEEAPSYVLCKPKLLPLKSFTLEKLEKVQKEAQEKAAKLQTDEGNDETQNEMIGSGEAQVAYF